MCLCLSIHVSVCLSICVSVLFVFICWLFVECYYWLCLFCYNSRIFCLQIIDLQNKKDENLGLYDCRFLTNSILIFFLGYKHMLHDISLLINQPVILSKFLMNRYFRSFELNITSHQHLKIDALLILQFRFSIYYSKRKINPI